ncbi:hypothetical protein ACFWP2_17435 [Kitasatospora sp. NPDC058444]|uniref:hypothetical protein n=1 Tax=Kitasatospora sp. NPDC058444 TaxID=3346504 RepID=UPI00365E5FC1
MREQPSRTEPPDTVPEFRTGRGAGRSAPPRVVPGSRTAGTPRTRDGHERWPPRALPVGLGYGTEGGRGPLSRRAAPTGGRDRRARPLDICDRTPVTPAARAGVAIETTEDRA